MSISKTFHTSDRDKRMKKGTPGMLARAEKDAKKPRRRKPTRSEMEEAIAIRARKNPVIPGWVSYSRW